MPISVAIICPSHSQGLQDYTLNLAKGMQGQDIDLHVLVNESYSHKQQTPGTDVIFTGRKFADTLRLFTQLKDIKPDIVHSQTTNMGVLAVLFIAKSVLGFSLVLTPHSSRSHWKRPIYQRIQPTLYNLFDGVIWHTKQDADRMRAEGVSTRQRVIKHGNYSFYADRVTELSKESAREQLKLHRDRYMFLFFGYLRPDKRLDLLIEAFGDLPQDVQQRSQLVIAGNPMSTGQKESLSNKLDQSIESEGVVSTWFEFINEEQLPVFFKACDAVVTPYDTISDSGIVHIAFAFGKPVLASNVEGFAETLTHGVNGILFEAGSRRSLSNALSSAVREKSTLDSMGKTNKQLADENSWEKIGSDTYNFYLEILGKR